MNFLIDKPHIFSAKLQKWYNKHKRNLPWRNTNNAYKIWLSEIILQQTRVNQGMAYYQKFVRHYPTVAELAKADEQAILKDWQGLGYYSRARNLHAAAKTIHYDLKSEFPTTFQEVKKLKGVGDYTAAAIVSFAFNEAKAVLDGNVYRVLARLSGSAIPIDSTQGKKHFQQLADLLLDQKDPATHNQAIMEFGALQCTPKNPDCSTCIFKTDCVANKLEIQAELPVKAKKLKQRKRYFNYLIIECDQELLINKRTEKGIWQNLHDFPLVETDKKISAQHLIHQPEFIQEMGTTNYKLIASSEERKHILSHQIILAKFYHLKIESKSVLKSASRQWIPKSQLKDIPIPKLIENYLLEETNFLSLFN